MFHGIPRGRKELAVKTSIALQTQAETGRAQLALLSSFGGLQIVTMCFHRNTKYFVIFGLALPSTDITFSSPCAKRAGPKGLRAESARAVTGRRCPHSGKGEDFLTGQSDFFTATAVTPERKVEKLFPRLEINRHGEG